MIRLLFLFVFLIPHIVQAQNKEVVALASPDGTFYDLIKKEDGSLEWKSIKPQDINARLFTNPPGTFTFPEATAEIYSRWIKVKPNNGAEFEIKPSGSYSNFQLISVSQDANTIIKLSDGYFHVYWPRSKSTQVVHLDLKNVVQILPYSSGRHLALTEDGMLKILAIFPETPSYSAYEPEIYSPFKFRGAVNKMIPFNDDILLLLHDGSMYKMSRSLGYGEYPVKVPFPKGVSDWSIFSSSLGNEKFLNFLLGKAPLKVGNKGKEISAIQNPLNRFRCNQLFKGL